MTDAMTAKRERDALLQDYRQLREAGASPMRRREAYNQWFHRCCLDGCNPSALSTHSPDEIERFWAHTIPGLDNHVLWTGPRNFIRNDGKQRSPQRWVWQHTHGGILQTTQELEITCGEEKCVNVEHLSPRHRSARRVRFSDERAVSALQVLAMQLGRTPSKIDWDKFGPKVITGSGLTARFRSWGEFIRKANLVNVRSGSATPELCVEAILAMHDKIGHAPDRFEWADHRDWLRARGYPTAPNTIRNRLGMGFAAAVQKALDER